jgi:hypothetical protein
MVGISLESLSKFLICAILSLIFLFFFIVTSNLSTELFFKQRVLEELKNIYSSYKSSIGDNLDFNTSIKKKQEELKELSSK